MNLKYEFSVFQSQILNTGSVRALFVANFDSDSENLMFQSST
jgi:hypothetical protein